jgi:hypothetical protein
MGTAILDAGQGNLKWSHWQQGNAGAACRLPERDRHRSCERTIFRLVFRTELEPNEALDNAGMVVEFGPVDWGTRPISAR